MFCQDCKDKKTCKAICKPLNNYLKRKTPDRLYSDRTIERREIPTPPSVIDKDMPIALIKRKYGGRVRNTFRGI